MVLSGSYQRKNIEANAKIKQEESEDCSTLGKDVIDLSQVDSSETSEEELKLYLSEVECMSDPLKW